MKNTSLKLNHGGNASEVQRTHKMLETLSVLKPWEKQGSVSGFLNSKQGNDCSSGHRAFLIWPLVILFVFKN
jgi:hypothetical protein